MDVYDLLNSFRPSFPSLKPVEGVSDLGFPGAVLPKW